MISKKILFKETELGTFEHWRIYIFLDLGSRGVGVTSNRRDRLGEARFWQSRKGE